jgi:hypothetical protein
MKHFLLLLLTLQIATGNLFGHELSKLPFVWAHYEEHKAEDATLTILDFLNLHYNNEEHEKQDGHRHHNLPLHCSSHILNVQVADIVRFINLIVEEKNTSILSFSFKNAPFYSLHFCSTELVERLLRPPNGLVS